jgi:Fur family transcriptional regulator, ferric uptake regulator
MTVPHASRPLAAASIPAAVTTLRSRGLRVSAARRLVLEALFTAQAPVTAEAIADGLGDRLPRSDLASVYRNLDTLEQIGMVRHFHLGHGAGLYALAGRHEDGYAACGRCGSHLPLPSAVVARMADFLRAATGYEAELSHFPIVGRCPDCEERHAHS